MNDPVWQRIYCSAIHGKARMFVEKEEDSKTVWDCESYYQDSESFPLTNFCRRRWVIKKGECLVGKKVSSCKK